MSAPMFAPPTGRPPRAVAALLAVFALALAPSADAQGGGVRPDQVFRFMPRTGTVTKLIGTVKENSLTRVRVELADKEQDIDSADVRRIVWGDVPNTFRDGLAFADRGDWENAVQRFRAAAGDQETRAVVRAAARHEAAEALLRWGSDDPNRFSECAGECEVFLADHPDDRGVPRARWLQARATWLSGDAAKASALFQALYDEGSGDTATPGYDRTRCLEAGLQAARSALEASDTSTARTLFSALQTAFGQASAAAGDDAELRARLDRFAGEAEVGEGFCLLAGGQAGQAQSFFEGRLRGARDAGTRFASTLGLAEAYRAGGDLRRAQIQFATVSALDYSDRDRRAQALVGLADVTVQLGGAGATAEAQVWLDEVKELYGDTPAASRL